jgi:ABC-2 type transport system permease protein
MSTLAPARPVAAPGTRLVSDSTTLLKRGLVRLVRYPSMTLLLVGMPVLFLLLFVYVFGGTLGNGLATPGGKDAYLVYVVPGILLMAIAAGGQGTAISVAMDMREGIVARLRTMAISRAAVLTAHAITSVVQCLVAVVASLAVAFAIGYRAQGGVPGVLGALAVLVAISFALTWLCVALGMVSDSVETASNLPMPLTILPFLSSGFVPTESMPAGLRWFAEYQPFTPFIETVRALLDGTAPGTNGWLALGWFVVITGGSFVWSLRLFDRSSTK